MSESIRSFCYFIYNEGITEFTAKDYVVFTFKAIGYSVKDLMKKNCLNKLIAHVALFL